MNRGKWGAGPGIEVLTKVLQEQWKRLYLVVVR